MVVYIVHQNDGDFIGPVYATRAEAEAGRELQFNPFEWTISERVVLSNEA